MSSKRKTREFALQLLFLWDAHGESDTEMTEQALKNVSDGPVTAQRGREIAQGAWEKRAIADQWMERLAPQWPPRRQPAVDRCIMRLAVWELTNSDTPPKVVIDEAIELAKLFSTENSPAFVNGVLDAILKEHRSLIAEHPDSPPGSASKE